METFLTWIQENRRFHGDTSKITQQLEETRIFCYDENRNRGGSGLS